jgi:1-acyl-sn-glycerol-3-phosphate acyltransferase
MRTGAWLLAFAGFAVAAASIPVRLRGLFLRRWARQMLRVLGIRLVCSGVGFRLRGPALLIANHVSSIDPLLVGAIAPACFVAKSQLAAPVWLRWPLAAAGTIFIDRGRRKGVLHALAQMYEAFDAGETVALFPEATVSADPGPRRFNPALLEPASKGMPTYVIALSLTRADGMPCPEADFSPGQGFAASFWRLSAVPETIARAVVLGPFDFAGVPRKRIAAIAHEAVRRALLPAQICEPPRRAIA